MEALLYLPAHRARGSRAEFAETVEWGDDAAVPGVPEVGPIEVDSAIVSYLDGANELGHELVSQGVWCRGRTCF
jgi:hypothetical protein